MPAQRLGRGHSSSASSAAARSHVRRRQTQALMVAFWPAPRPRLPSDMPMPALSFRRPGLHPVPDRLQRMHELWLVWAPALQKIAPRAGGTRLLGHGLLRITPRGGREPHRQRGAFHGPAQDRAGGHYPDRIRSVLNCFPRRAPVLELPFRADLHARRGGVYPSRPNRRLSAVLARSPATECLRPGSGGTVDPTRLWGIIAPLRV